MLATRSLAIFLTESRLIVFLYNLVALSLTLMLLKGVDISNGTILLLLVLAMLPYYVGSTLLPILYIGKRLDLKDEDFRCVFLGWVLVVREVAGYIVAQIRECLRLRITSHQRCGAIFFSSAAAIVPEEVVSTG